MEDVAVGLESPVQSASRGKALRALAAVEYARPQRILAISCAASWSRSSLRVSSADEKAYAMSEKEDEEGGGKAAGRSIGDWSDLHPLSPNLAGFEAELMNAHDTFSRRNLYNYKVRGSITWRRLNDRMVYVHLVDYRTSEFWMQCPMHIDGRGRPVFSHPCLQWSRRPR